MPVEVRCPKCGSNEIEKKPIRNAAAANAAKSFILYLHIAVPKPI